MKTKTNMNTEEEKYVRDMRTGAAFVSVMLFMVGMIAVFVAKVVQHFL